jgi:hypothetical protein
MRRKQRHDDKLQDLLALEQAGFLPDEAAVDARTGQVELRERVTKLEQQVMGQYTAMAAYATIAKQDVETARAEARAEIDRSQATSIGLMEKVRREFSDSLSGVEHRLGSGPDGGASRVVALESTVRELRAALDESLAVQRRLTEQVASLVRDQMERDGWLASSGTADELSLR